MQYKTPANSAIVTDPRYKRNHRYSWLTPKQQNMLERLSTGGIKPDFVSPRRRVVMRNLIMKGLVEYQTSPEDLYVLTGEGNVVLTQWIPRERRHRTVEPPDLSETASKTFKKLG
jgi:hypothetical protein